MLRFRMVERRGEEGEASEGDASIHVEGEKKEGGMREPNSRTRRSTQPVAAIAEQMESDGREQKGVNAA